MFIDRRTAHLWICNMSVEGTQCIYKCSHKDTFLSDLPMTMVSSSFWIVRAHSWLLNALVTGLCQIKGIFSKEEKLWPFCLATSRLSFSCPWQVKLFYFIFIFFFYLSALHFQYAGGQYFMPLSLPPLYERNEIAFTKIAHYAVLK